MSRIVLNEVIRKISQEWEPVDIAYVNETAMRIAKVDGAYDWHVHQKEDEFFLVVKGKIFIDMENESVELNEMEGYLVKQGIRHRSRSEKPAWILLIEPRRTKTRGE